MYHLQYFSFHALDYKVTPDRVSFVLLELLLIAILKPLNVMYREAQSYIIVKAMSYITIVLHNNGIRLTAFLDMHVRPCH